ncbi:MAG TPA: 4Fe-4S dicluster domain-containing protein [Candidatus Binatia bacterium]|nr:4Fe-4S dicluster domain-containing protein [Candidatus Binatia bacterium]
MSKAILIDTTKCIGCRSCQVSCKEWNGLPGEITAVPRAGLGLQNPVTVSSKTLTLMTYHEVAEAGAPGGLKYVFAKRQCMHCDDPACASACPVTALHKTEDGPVTYDSGKCIGCRYCVWACPFGAPTVQWDSLAPEIRKCTMCYDRISQPAPEARNGHALTEDEKKRFSQQEAVPVCVKQCPAGALKFGEKDALLAEAKGRIQAHPEKYVDHIYGEHEAGGTSTFYLAGAPFAALGFPQVGMRAYPGASVAALHAVPLSVVGMGALLGGSYAVYQRRAAVTQAAPALAAAGSGGAVLSGPYKPIGHQETPPAPEAKAAPATGGMLSSLHELLKFCIGFGAILLLLRLAAGWRANMQLSAAYPWWSWIFSDSVWITAVAGALVSAGLIYMLRGQRLSLPAAQGHARGRPAAEAGHVEFAPVRRKSVTPVDGLLKLLIGFGVLSFLIRFVAGLGGSTHLSDTYPWGLWIVFDFAWISIAAGAFATAGLIYVFHREDLYAFGRSAVLMGLVSYTFVTVVLVADLGLPWHFWQLSVQAPRHSAMFEVSWCIFLYLTVLAFEFLPIPCERWGLERAMELWRKYSPLYVVAAATLFTYLMSRSLVYTTLAAGVFGFLAFAFRPRAGEKHLPIMLAIAAVTFSTMHQSSLGSLFLLMPDKLDALWWSPVLPLDYFLSSVAAGTALVILIEMWIAKGYGRALPIRQLAALGKITMAFLFVYELVRVADVGVRGQLPRALAGGTGGLFLAEVCALGLCPLLLLLSNRLRQQPAGLGLAAFLTVVGVIFNRANAVFFAMNLKGPMPQIAPSGYIPSVWEWGVSLGMGAAAVVLFRWGANNLPVLPKQEAQPLSSVN